MLWMFFVSMASLVFACAMGGYCLKKYLPTDDLSRILFGFCLSPFVLASYVGALSVCYPGAPDEVYPILLLMLSAISIVFMWRHTHTLKLISDLPYTSDFLQHKKNANVMLFAMSLVLLAVLISYSGYVAYLVSQPLHSHDSNVYFAQALNFTELKSPAGWTHFDAAPGYLASGHPHTFFFELILSFGLMVNRAALGTNRLVFTADLPAKLLVIFCAIAMLVAVINLARQVTTHYLAVFAGLLVFCIPNLNYMIENLNRDGFRLLSFVLLVSLFVFYINKKQTNELKFGHFMLLGLINAFSMWSHLLNIFFMPFVILASFPFLLKNKHRKKMVYGYILLAFITTIALLSYWWRWYYFGTPLVGMTYLNYTRDVFSALKQFNLSHSATSLNSFTTRYLYFPSLIGVGLISALAIVSIKIFSPKKVRLAALYLSFLYIVLSLLPWLNLGRGMSLHEAFAMNLRYVWQIEIFSPVIIICFIGFIYSWFTNRYLIWLKNIILVLCVAYIGFLIHGKIGDIQARSMALNKLLRKRYSYPILASIKSLRAEDNWVTDDTFNNYFIKNKPIFLYSIYGKKLLEVKDRSQLFKLFHSWHVKKVILYHTSLNNYIFQHAHDVFHQVFSSYLTPNNLSGAWYIFTIKNNDIRPERIDIHHG